jgi:light-regulated signal transduction histidine kinase (bacteriophytochrome)
MRWPAPNLMSDAMNDAGRADRDVARRSERLAAAVREFETLSSAVSHDFQMPLAMIEWSARALSENLHAPSVETGMRVQAIRANVATMQAMIANLRELCVLAGQTLELESIDMEALVRAAWAGIEDREGVALSLGKLPSVRGHRGMLSLVWTNLLRGALRRSAGQERARIEVTGGASGEFAVYSVSDNGRVLDLEYAGKLFYVFEQVQKQAEHPGTGVELAIVQRIVTRHRGNVWVEARRNKGATFQFSLPIGEAL